MDERTALGETIETHSSSVQRTRTKRLRDAEAWTLAEREAVIVAGRQADSVEDFFARVAPVRGGVRAPGAYYALLSRRGTGVRRELRRALRDRVQKSVPKQRRSPRHQGVYQAAGVTPERVAEMLSDCLVASGPGEAGASDLSRQLGRHPAYVGTLLHRLRSGKHVAPKVIMAIGERLGINPFGQSASPATKEPAAAPRAEPAREAPRAGTPSDDRSYVELLMQLRDIGKLDQAALERELRRIVAGV